MKRLLIASLATATVLLPMTAAHAEDSASAPKADALMGEERVNVENIKAKYWARGDEKELGVVQNRMFTKADKFELGVFGGFVTSDPFLNTQTMGASLGYHFNEYISINVFGMKDFVSPSSALDQVRKPTDDGGLGADAPTNQPKWVLGTEAEASILYGKLSLLGKAIIHYDFHFLGGLAMTNTESGTYLTPEFGVGQQFFLSKTVTLRFDYRLMIYHENLLENNPRPTSPAGSIIGDRNNFSNTITFGLSFMIDPFGKKAPAEVTK